MNTYANDAEEMMFCHQSVISMIPGDLLTINYDIPCLPADDQLLCSPATKGRASLDFDWEDREKDEASNRWHACSATVKCADRSDGLDKTRHRECATRSSDRLPADHSQDRGNTPSQELSRGAVATSTSKSDAANDGYNDSEMKNKVLIIPNVDVAKDVLFQAPNTGKGRVEGSTVASPLPQQQPEETQLSSRQRHNSADQWSFDVPSSYYDNSISCNGATISSCDSNEKTASTSDELLSSREEITQEEDEAHTTRNVYVKLPGRKQRKRYTVQKVEEAAPLVTESVTEAASNHHHHHYHHHHHRSVSSHEFDPPVVSTPADNFASGYGTPAGHGQAVAFAPLKLEIPGSDDPVQVDPRAGGVCVDLPRLDFASLDLSDPVPSQQGRFSFQTLRDHLNTTEALVSPRSSTLQGVIRSEQDLMARTTWQSPDYRNRSNSKEDIFTSHMKYLIKRIQSLKMKIEKFDEEYEKKQGYKPSHTYKLTQPEVKKWIQELNRAKRELQNYTVNMSQDRYNSDWSSQESCDTQYHTWHASSGARLRKFMSEDFESLSDTEMDNKPWVPATPASSGEIEPTPSPSVMTPGGDSVVISEQTLPVIHSRPLDIPLAVKDAAMKFSIVDPHEFKHPVSPPLKVLFSRSDSDQPKQHNNVLDRRKAAAASRGRLFTKTPPQLDIVPEGSVVTEFALSSSEKSSRSSSFSSHEIQQQQQQPQQLVIAIGDALTGVSTVPTLSPSPTEIPSLHLGKGLHELTLPQLIQEQRRTLADKRRRRKELQDFEAQILQEGGRRLQRDDHSLMDVEYSMYKEVKAKLKLLDALIAKHDPMLNSWKFVPI